MAPATLLNSFLLPALDSCKGQNTFTPLQPKLRFGLLAAIAVLEHLPPDCWQVEELQLATEKVIRRLCWDSAMAANRATIIDWWSIACYTKGVSRPHLGMYVNLTFYFVMGNVLDILVYLNVILHYSVSGQPSGHRSTVHSRERASLESGLELGSRCSPNPGADYASRQTSSCSTDRTRYLLPFIVIINGLINSLAAYRQSVVMLRADSKRDADGKPCLEDRSSTPVFQSFVPPASDGGPLIPLFLQDWNKGIWSFSTPCCTYSESFFINLTEC